MTRLTMGRHMLLRELVLFCPLERRKPVLTKSGGDMILRTKGYTELVSVPTYVRVGGSQEGQVEVVSRLLRWQKVMSWATACLALHKHCLNMLDPEVKHSQTC